MRAKTQYVAGPRLPYSVVSEAVLRDGRLTYGAKGLYAVLCTLPEGTEFSREDIGKWTADGEFRVRQYLVELTEAKFLVMQRIHDGRRFVASRYVFCASGGGGSVPKVVSLRSLEVDNHLAVKIGKMLPERSAAGDEEAFWKRRANGPV